MKSEKGITLTSLGIYIVIILIALITLATITAYFRSNVNEFNTKTTVDLEFDKFNLYFIEEVKKTNNKIDETNSTETKISFSSGNTYEFSDNSIMLNGNVKIAEKIEACTFNFFKDENNLQVVTVYIKVGETERTNQYTLSSQTTDIQNDEDYIYGYKRVSGTNELILDNSIKTSLKEYKIYGNSVQDGTPTPETPVEIESVGDKTKNLIDITKTQEGYISTNGNLVQNTKINTTDFIYVEENKEYVFSYEYDELAGTSGKIIAFYTDEDETTYVQRTAYVPSVKVVEIVAPITGYMRLCYYNNIYNIQLEEGREATEYEPYGKYKIPITVNGKNLLNPNKVEDKNNYIVSFSGETLAPSATGGTWRASDFIPIVEGRTYNLTAINNNASAAGMAWYDSNKTYISGLNTTQINSNNGNMTAPSNAEYLRISWRIDDGYNPDWKNIVQLEEGTEATEYEPYVEPTIANIFLDEPLRKVGDYADYIDFENQKVVRNIKLGILTTNGTSSVGSNGEDIVKFYYTKFTDRKISTNNEIAVLATGLAPLSYSEYSKTNSSNLQSIAGGISNVAVFFKIGKTLIGGDTIEDCKTYLKENPITVHYILETPTEELIELPTLSSYKGTTTIRIDTEIPPSNTEVVYYSK